MNIDRDISLAREKRRRYSWKVRTVTPLLLFIVFGLFANVVNAENRIDILTKEAFEVSVNKEHIATYTPSFNFTVPAHVGNVTLVLNYVNELEGVVYEKCYVMDVSLYMDDESSFFEHYNNAQEFTLTIELNVTSDFEHKGEIILCGTSSTVFYGTIDLYVTYVPESSGWFDWIPFGSNGLFFIILFSSFGIPVTLILVRRRRRGKEKEE